jgi:hypothetical protein
MESLSLNRTEKQESKSEDLALAHIDSEYKKIEAELKSDKFWGRCMEVLGGGALAVGVMEIIAKSISPDLSLQIPPEIANMIQNANFDTIAKGIALVGPLFFGPQLLSSGLDRVRIGMAEAVKKKKSLLGPYLKSK